MNSHLVMLWGAMLHPQTWSILQFGLKKDLYVPIHCTCTVIVTVH